MCMDLLSIFERSMSFGVDPFYLKFPLWFSALNKKVKGLHN